MEREKGRPVWGGQGKLKYCNMPCSHQITLFTNPLATAGLSAAVFASLCKVSLQNQYIQYMLDALGRAWTCLDVLDKASIICASIAGSTSIPWSTLPQCSWLKFNENAQVHQCILSTPHFLYIWLASISESKYISNHEYSHLFQQDTIHSVLEA